MILSLNELYNLYEVIIWCFLVRYCLLKLFSVNLQPNILRYNPLGLSTYQKNRLLMYMKKIIYFILILCFISFVLSWKITPSISENIDGQVEHVNKDLPQKSIPSSAKLIDEQIQDVFQKSGLDSSELSYEVFRKAHIGFINLKTAGEVPASARVLSIVDFNMSSKRKRLWIVDLDKKEVLLNTWVSHGRGSGDDIATKFSNTNSSYQSSIGFYVTGEVYNGKHGRSLRLDGMDAGFNNRARERAIVIHGADYVSAQTIKNLNRLGLSHGCPAVPSNLSNQIIDIVKDKTVLFINAKVSSYTSKYLNEDLAGKTLLASFLDHVERSEYGRM